MTTRRERRLAVISVAVSCLSLLISSGLALQQLRLSDRVNRASVSVLDAENVGFDYRRLYVDPTITFRCSHDIRLYNSGGTKASLVGFDVTAHLRGGSIGYVSRGAESDTTRPWLYVSSDDRLRRFGSRLVTMSDRERAGPTVERPDVAVTTWRGDDRLAAVPMQLHPSETTVVHLETTFDGEGVSGDELLLSGGGYDPIERLQPTTHDPLDLSLQFRLASGDRVAVEGLRCLFLKRPV